MNNQASVGIFAPDSPINKQPEGSWQINGNLRHGDKYEDQVRMAVGTPYGHEQRKNVGITGYARVLSADSDNDHLDWYARGGIHNRDVQCSV
jgi:hypothetical protein